MGKISYLDGLRGTAAIMVFFSHFRIAFLPEVSGYFVNFFCDGFFAVMIFFILSGFVLSNSFFAEKNAISFKFSSIKRYFRLEFPIIFSLILVYLLSILSLFYNQQASHLTNSDWLQSFFTGIPTVLHVLFDSFIGIIILGNVTLNPVLWTMRVEFYGSLLIFAILFIFKNNYFNDIKYRFIFYAFVLLLISDTFFAGFIIGMILCDLKNSHIISNHKNNFILFYAFVGVFIGSFMITFLSVTGFSDLKLILSPTLYIGQKNLLFFIGGHSVFWSLRLIGASLLVFAFVRSNLLQHTFSKPLFIFLGKISFSLYTMHLIVLCSLSSYLFIIFNNHLSYNESVLLVFVITLLFTVVIANYATDYIDNPGIKMSKRISLTMNQWISHLPFFKWLNFFIDVFRLFVWEGIRKKIQIHYFIVVFRNFSWLKNDAGWWQPISWTKFWINTGAQIFTRFCKRT